MTTTELWDKFTDAKGIEKGTKYEAWAFGSTPDELAALVISGIKVATSSAYPLYEKDGEPLPRVGDYSVILNSKDEAVCVIQTTAVEILPYNQVGEEHALKEGEGDKSLDHWRRVHCEFFAKEMKSIGDVFIEDMPVVCEELRCVFTP